MATSSALSYDQVIDICKNIFQKKTQDYGSAWRILRLPSITDQIMIKAQRIRSIQEIDTQQIEDDMAIDLVGIINYSIIALIQIVLPKDTSMSLQGNQLVRYYDQVIREAAVLCKKKNHDYQDAWKCMRISSIIDIILMKLLRIQNMENQCSSNLISEGVESNYFDIINYAIFMYIRDYESSSQRL